MTVPSVPRQLWRTLAGDPAALEPGTVTEVRGSRGIAPAGWAGVVRLGDAFVIEAGEADAEALEVLRRLDDPSDPAEVVVVLRPARTLGPGEVFYLPVGGDVDGEVATIEVGGEVEEVPVTSIADWLALLPAEDVEESSLHEMEDVLVLRRDGQVLGAAGHLDWPSNIGHLGVLVAPRARGKGVGSALGAAATRRVLDLGRHPQWRAATHNEASKTVAGRIGYEQMGRQFSFQLT